jgi:chaperonin GroEL (HSP60 family)
MFGAMAGSASGGTAKKQYMPPPPTLCCCRLAIGDLGTQYFADRGIFCAGRVADEDLQRVAKATGW